MALELERSMVVTPTNAAAHHHHHHHHHLAMMAQAQAQAQARARGISLIGSRFSSATSNKSAQAQQLEAHQLASCKPDSTTERPASETPRNHCDQAAGRPRNVTQVQSGPVANEINLPASRLCLNGGPRLDYVICTNLSTTSPREHSITSSKKHVTSFTNHFAAAHLKRQANSHNPHSSAHQSNSRPSWKSSTSEPSGRTNCKTLPQVSSCCESKYLRPIRGTLTASTGYTTIATQPQVGQQASSLVAPRSRLISPPISVTLARNSSSANYRTSSSHPNSRQQQQQQVSVNTSISRLRQGALQARRQSRQYLASTNAINCSSATDPSKTLHHQRGSLDIGASARQLANSISNSKLSTSNRIRHLARSTSVSASTICLNSLTHHQQTSLPLNHNNQPSVIACRASGSRASKQIDCKLSAASISPPGRLASGKTAAKFSLASSTSSLSLVVVTKRPRPASGNRSPPSSSHRQAQLINRLVDNTITGARQSVATCLQSGETRVCSHSVGAQNHVGTTTLHLDAQRERHNQQNQQARAALLQDETTATSEQTMASNRTGKSASENNNSNGNQTLGLVVATNSNNKNYENQQATLAEVKQSQLFNCCSSKSSDKAPIEKNMLTGSRVALVEVTPTLEVGQQSTGKAAEAPRQSPSSSSSSNINYEIEPSNRDKASKLVTVEKIKPADRTVKSNLFNVDHHDYDNNHQGNHRTRGRVESDSERFQFGSLLVEQNENLQPREDILTKFCSLNANENRLTNVAISSSTNREIPYNIQGNNSKLDSPIEIDFNEFEEANSAQLTTSGIISDCTNNNNQPRYHPMVLSPIATSCGASGLRSQPFGLHQSINIEQQQQPPSTKSNKSTVFQAQPTPQSTLSSASCLMIDSRQNVAVGQCLTELVDNIKSPTAVAFQEQSCPKPQLLFAKSHEQAPPIESQTDSISGSTKQLAQITIDIAIKSELINDFYDLDARPFARGKFAHVKRCVNKDTKQCFAAKCIKKRRRLVDISHEIFLEIEALKLSYYTKHIVKLFEVYETSNEIILVLEMANGGELQRVLDDEEFIEENIVKRMVSQILEGLIYLHDNEIAHLDIKPQNLLLTEPFPDGDIKLCDFGISRRITKDCEIREICGTPDYVAPEILRYDPISLATDMWSLGVLTYVLLSGYSPFGSDNKQQTFCNITQATLDFPNEIFDKISTEAIDFVKNLIVREPSGRLTSRQARQHHWLNSMHH